MSDASTPRPGRNEPCHCGSGRKYKHCCLDKDDAAHREAVARQAAEAPAAAPEPEPGGTSARGPKHRTYQPWKKSATNTHGFQRMSTPRKVGSG